MQGRKGGSARRRTDARLKGERRKADAALAEEADERNREAEAVIRLARQRAKEVLTAARDRADHRSRRSGRSSDAERALVRKERRRDDAALKGQYERADRGRAHDLDLRALTADALLGAERRKTDASLMLERAHADELVAKRDDFLGMVSHDLRNELSAMALNCASIVARTVNDDEQRDVFRAATTIQRINLRMSRLIGDLLDLVSIEAGKFTMRFSDHDVGRAIDEVVESFQLIAAGKGIALQWLPLGALSAGCDRGRIVQVLGNLLTNAIKFTPRGGRVIVRAERRSDDLRVSVSDTGPGIAPNQLDTIFERFVRGRSADRGGLGLGLFIARRIIDAHGGRIWAESTPGEGSTFTFSLPRRQKSQRRGSSPRAPRSSKRPLDEDTEREASP